MAKMKKEEADFMNSGTEKKRGRPAGTEIKTKRTYTRRTKNNNTGMATVEMPVEMADAYQMGWAAGQAASRSVSRQ